MNKSTLFIASVILAAPAAAQSITSTRIAGGMGLTNWVGAPSGGDTRLFVVRRKKGVLIIKDGKVLPDLFLDIQAELATNTQGIMGLAFHPEYATNGKFYIVYTDSNQLSHVAQYVVSGNPDRADPTSRVQILGPEPQPSVQHNWNFVEFGPDGKLYVGTGDGGGIDQTMNLAQDLSSILGKVLRVDVDIPPPYIPPDNPFVGVSGAREEIWFYGVRQPWRMTFDALTGNAFLADVGGSKWEEIDFIPSSSTGGENFGWRCLEADECTDFPNCLDCTDPIFVPPIYQYSPAVGCCIIGGHVYRGAAIPDLQGAYFFADHCTASVWSIRYDGTTVSDFRDWTEDLAGEGSATLGAPTSFGVDSEGELYIVDNDGEVWKIVPTPCCVRSYCMGSPNSAGPGTILGSTGSPDVSRNDFTLTVSGAVPQELGLFYYGSDSVQLPFGNGMRCVGGDVFRLLPPLTIDSLGEADRGVDFTDPRRPEGEILRGSTWYFQFWYRDGAGGGSGFNLSDGLSVTFCP